MSLHFDISNPQVEATLAAAAANRGIGIAALVETMAVEFLPPVEILIDDSKGIRLQVLLNGEVVTTAGMDDRGVLSAILTRVFRSEANHARLKGKELDNEEEISLSVGGLSSLTDEHVRWYDESVKRGDEITIRILDAGNFDEPYERFQIDVAGRGLATGQRLLKESNS